jgi:hypothetical protein
VTIVAEQSETAELIARLEAATGPASQLGGNVLLACGWTIEEDCVDARFIWWVAPYGEEFVDGSQPDPTSSIDAALKLARHHADVVVMLQAAFKAAESYDGPADLWPSIQAALIAALKARANQNRT